MGQVNKPFYPYQLQALEFIKSMPDSYLQLDMGLGKTRIALEWLLNKVDNGVLIIAPLKAIYTTWPEEIEKWGYTYSHTILHGADKLYKLGQKKRVYLINFEGIQWLFKELKVMFSITKRLPFRTLIIDEGSKVKDPTTKRFKVLKALRDIFHNRLILSGTPSPNSLLDIWSQYYILDGGTRLFKTMGKYKMTYFMPVDYRQYSWAIRSEEDKTKIYDKVKDITFRLDGDDYVKLPGISYNTIKLKLPSSLMSKYKELEKQFFIELNETDTVEAFSAASLSMKLRQFIQGAMYTDDKGSFTKVHTEKLDLLKEMVETADGQGILCPIQFKFDLKMIQKIYPKVPAIVGGVPMVKAAEYIKAWNRKEIPLLVCHPASLSHAVNMQYGSYIMFWYALTWSSEQYLQLNKRLYRNGQEHPVIIHHACIENTIDIAVMRALRAKIKGQQQFLNYIKEYHEKMQLYKNTSKHNLAKI